MLYEMTVESFDFEVLLLFLVIASRHYKFRFPSLLNFLELDTKFVPREGGRLQFANFRLLSRSFRELNTHRRL